MKLPLLLPAIFVLFTGCKNEASPEKAFIEKAKETVRSEMRDNDTAFKDLKYYKSESGGIVCGEFNSMNSEGRTPFLYMPEGVMIPVEGTDVDSSMVREMCDFQAQMESLID